MTYLEAWSERKRLERTTGKMFDIIPTEQAESYELRKMVDEQIQGEEILFTMVGCYEDLQHYTNYIREVLYKQKKRDRGRQPKSRFF